MTTTKLACSSDRIFCGSTSPPGPICGAIMIGRNNSTSKPTIVPWNAGSATPTTVSG